MFLGECRCSVIALLFQGTADALKRQVKEEMLTKATIAARITSDTGESEKFEQETIQKKGKVDIPE